MNGATSAIVEGIMWGLLTASVMMTVSFLITIIFFRSIERATPQLRQRILFCILLQGLMLIRFPVELPWLALEDSAATIPSTVVLSDRDPLALQPSMDSIEWDALRQWGDSRAVVPPSNRPSVSSLFGTPVWSVGFDALTEPSLVLLFWFLGTLTVLGCGCARYRSVCRRVDCMDEAPAHWQSEWQAVCIGNVRSTPMMLVSRSDGPMMIRRRQGYALVVPQGFWESLTTIQRRGVLLHELAHLRRHDVWKQLVACVAVAFHWWNPAAWWCLRRYEESAEWACDEMLMRAEPDAARGLASSLVQFVEYFRSIESAPQRVTRVLGMQSMAAPPLTNRVKRLLKPSTCGESIMNRVLLGSLAIVLLMLSTLHFRLVAAPPDQPSDEVQTASASPLRVLATDTKDHLQKLQQRLNPADKASAELRDLLGRESGQIAIAGLIDQLKSNLRETAATDAIPRFTEKHFQTAADGTLTLRSESQESADSWVQRSRDLGTVLASMQQRMQSLADRLDDSDSTNQMARRMLSDPEIAFAVVMKEFEGRSDPIELFLAKTMEKLLVQRGDHMIVIPTLGSEGIKQIERFERATRLCAELQKELPEFAKEFAQPDARHQRFVKSLNDPAMAAVLALHISKDKPMSAGAAVNELFERLEEVTRDTADGLVIDDDQAWTNLEEILESADRSGKRVAAVREQLRRIADDLDMSDPITARFAAEIKTGVIAYQAAADVPYADFDLGKQVEGMISQVLESAGGDRLRVRPDAAEQVNQRAGELLADCRTIRRYLRQIDAMIASFSDHDLAESLDGPGRMLLLNEIRRTAVQGQVDPIQLLQTEFFSLDESNQQLTVRADQIHVVAELVQRAKALEAELSKNDF